MVGENTLPDMIKKARASSKDFSRFVKNCRHELIKTGSTVCFTKEHLEALSKEFDIQVVHQDGYYEVTLKEVL